MPNYIPYLGLIIISILFFTLSWFKAAGSKKLIPLYLAITGFIYVFEYVVLVLFKGYAYSPGVLSNKYFDNILGATVSDGFIVPSLAVFIAVFDLGWWWIVIIILCLLGIELFFLHLGVYWHYWWKTIYTGLNLPINFMLAKRVWHIIRFPINRISFRLLILYFSNISAQATVVFCYAAVFHLFFFRVGWFDNPTRSHVAFATIYVFITSLLFSLAVVLKVRWLWNIFLIGGIFCLNFILHKSRIMEIPGFWVLGFFALSHTAILLFLMYMQKLLVKEKLLS